MTILDNRAATWARRDEAAGRVYVNRLTLTNFRCFAHLRVDVGPQPVVLTGANGSGKTSVLEAVSFLAPGRGLRRVRLDEPDRWQSGTETGSSGETGGTGLGQSAWAVAAQLTTSAGIVEIGTGREGEPTAGHDRRAVRIDGANQRSQTALAEVVAVTWLTPDMDRLFIEGASGRRRLLDRIVFGIDPGHADRAGAYQRALRERARLLRDGGGDAAWLGALEEMMATNGVAVAAARRDAVLRLGEMCGEPAGPFPGLDVEVDGLVEGWLAETPALACEDRFRTLLAAGRGADAESGATRSGPHRSDLVVRHRGTRRLAQACSTGEQKALLIALMLGGARLQAVERGALPLILLDEVTAHLDSRHRGALLDMVAEMDAQSWLTGSDPAIFRPLRDRAQFLALDSGDLTADDRTYVQSRTRLCGEVSSET